jgi:hypothetical protein
MQMVASSYFGTFLNVLTGFALVFGVFIILVSSIGAYMMLNSNEKDDNGKDNTNKDNEGSYDDVWLKIVAFGNNGESSIKRTDTQLIIHVGIASYNPSKIGKAPYAKIEIHGCGVDYVGNADENGFLKIPVKYNSSGKLIIKATYDTLTTTKEFKVE